MNEIQLTMHLCKKLQGSENIKQIQTGFQLANNLWFKQEWNDIHICNQLIPPPIQPSPDIVYIDSEDRLIGIEVKTFKLKNKISSSITRSFYDGIGQAIVMLTWGFDHVGVWHIFEDNVNENKRELYGTIWEILHNELQLPIEFTYILFDSKNDLFYPINRYTFIEKNRVTLLTANTLPIDHREFKFTYRFPNPQLMKNKKTSQLRELMIKCLSNMQF